MRSRNVRRLLSQDDICLITQPQIAKLVGRTASTLLQQMHYWLTTEKKVGVVLNDQRWIYNSYKAWADMIGLSESTVRRAIYKLEKLGIILSQNLNKKKYDQTKWYSIDYQALEKIIPSFKKISEKGRGEALEDKDQMDPVKMTTPSGQNDQIFIKKSKILTEKISLTPISSEIIHSCEQEEKKSSSLPLFSNLEENSVKDKDLPTHMLAIWNQIVEQGERICSLTKNRARYLLTALRRKFNNSLEQWKAFCEYLTSSSFLMGKKTSFKVSIDWILKFDTLHRLLEGDLGLEKPFSYNPSSQMDSLEEIKTEIEENEKEETKVKEIRLGLVHHFGQSIYVSWFKDLEILFSQGKIHLKAQSRFIKDWIETHFMSSLNQLFSKQLPTYHFEVKC